MIYRLGLLLLDSVIGGFDSYDTEMKNYEHVKYEINILDYILTNSKCELMKLQFENRISYPAQNFISSCLKQNEFKWTDISKLMLHDWVKQAPIA